MEKNEIIVPASFNCFLYKTRNFLSHPICKILNCTLTFRFPKHYHGFVIKQVEHSANNYGCQRSFRNVVERFRQEDQGQKENAAGNKTSKGSLCSRGVVDSRPGEGTCHRHGSHKGSGDVTQTQGKHFLGRVQRFSFCFKIRVKQQLINVRETTLEETVYVE